MYATHHTWYNCFDAKRKNRPKQREKYFWRSAKGSTLRTLTCKQIFYQERELFSPIRFARSIKCVCVLDNGKKTSATCKQWVSQLNANKTFFCTKLMYLVHSSQNTNKWLTNLLEMGRIHSIPFLYYVF